jgi:transcriptional regulator with XRE-family HTH domain
MSEVGRRIKELRERLRMNKREFAREIGVKDTLVYRWEKGEFEPTTEKLKAISKRFNVNLNWLLLGEGEMSIKREVKIPTEKASIVPELANFLALLPEEQQKQLASIFKEFLKTSSAPPPEPASPLLEEKQPESDRISESK